MDELPCKERSTRGIHFLTGVRKKTFRREKGAVGEKMGMEATHSPYMMKVKFFLS